MELSPVFVVGTGRCGSTLLSNCLGSHPDILSLSEFLVFVSDLGGQIPEVFPDEPVNGDYVWNLFAGAPPRQTLMLRNDAMMDEALYRPGPGRRFTKDSGIPAISATTLAHLDSDPDRLFDEIEPDIRSLPPAPIGDHYRRIFADWATRRNARVWVERSGGSLRIVHRLRQHFPDARFVHIVRDGRNTAISMSRHYGFRIALIAAQLTEILGVDPYRSPDRKYSDDIPDNLACYLPECFDADRFRNETVPLPLCGHYWSGEIITGLQELAGLPPDKLLTLRYEDILSAPKPTLTRFFEFILEGDVRCDVDAMAKTVRAPKSTWTDLPHTIRDQLSTACQPGFRALNDLYSKEFP